MEYQKFIPEGWSNEIQTLSVDSITKAKNENKIIEGRVNKCDSNYNLYVDLGNNVTGIIPRNEIEAVNIDEIGVPKPNICTSKVNKIIQFQVKDIAQANTVILSRKSVGTRALEWVKNELQEGMIVHGIVKNIKPYGAFVDIGRWSCRISSYRRYFSCKNQESI